MSWSPGEEMLSETSEEEPEELESLSDPNAVDKFIVCQRQLMSLFTVCPACSLLAKPRKGASKHACLQPFTQWCHPLLRLHGYSDNQDAEAVWTAVHKSWHFFPPSALLHYPYHRAGLRDEQRGIIRELKETGGGLILSGDCRSDSPGHCAKYGSYSLIEDRINKVLDVQLVQSSEVPSSSWCELEGLKRSMQFLMDQDMQVSALITDRNRQVAKWVREKMCSKGTRHFFDVWHIGKSVQKALDAAAKERDCEDLKLWSPAIINHLYWTAASTPTGDPDEMQAKWQSMINHVQDIHEHSTPAFNKCSHPPLEGEARNKEWLEPGTT
ncbi:uncharacterized protein [Pseudorasbora parva]|uniref:uncharacterized protein n=1 Tax=Pseudorasbora parva TaxID=51549 RepID=UPI00351F29F6